MKHSPTAVDLHEGLKSDTPTPIQKAAIRTWLCEASNWEIITALLQGAYSTRDLVRALHNEGRAAHRYELSRTLNGLCLAEWWEFRRQDDPWHDGR